jgi:glycosyltransferase involved in cell wall biosynthesis
MYRLTLGGAELLALDSFERLREHVDLWTIAIEDGVLNERFRGLGPVTVLGQLDSSADGAGQEAVEALGAELLHWRPDLVYINAIAALPIAAAIELPPTPVLLHLHNIATSLRFGVERHSDAFRSLPYRYLAVSEVLRRELIETYGIDERRIGLVHGFVTRDIAPADDPAPSKRPFIIGGAGNPSWLKGRELWLATAAELRSILGPDVDFRFSWVGVNDSEYNSQVFRYQAGKLGVEALVDFIPITPDPWPHYQKFDVFAMTSWEDTFPLVVLEAMCLEKPVLCFAGGGGAEEAVGDTGVIVPGFSPRAMAEAIAALYRSPERRAALGKAARKRVLENFTAEIQVPKLWAEIRRCAADMTDIPSAPAYSVPTDRTTAIILPVYNGARYLAQAIRGVMAQTVANWQLVIVDDGSSDNSGEVADYFARADRRIKVVRQENRGLSVARNQGIRNADPSDYVAFIDADDVWEPHWLETLIPELEASPNALGAHGLARFIDQNGYGVRPGQMEAFERNRKAIVDGKAVDWPVGAPTTFAVEAYRNYIPVCGNLVLRKAIEDAGLFTPGLRSCEDWELWLRMTQHGEFKFVDEVVYNYRLHSDNKTRDEEFETLLRLEVRAKVVHSPGISPEHRQIAIIGYRYEERQRITRHLALARQFRRMNKLVPAFKHLRQAGLAYLRSRHGAPPRPD